jgi:hypothetical protein
MFKTLKEILKFAMGDRPPLPPPPPAPERVADMCSYRGGALIITNYGSLFIVDENLTTGHFSKIQKICELDLYR